MRRFFQILLISLLGYSKVFAQEFERLPKEFITGVKPLSFCKILCTSKGAVLVANTYWILEIDGMKMELSAGYGGDMRDSEGNIQSVGRNSNIFKDMTESNLGVKLLCEGPEGVIYFVNENNNFGCFAYNKFGLGLLMPPFNFYTSTDKKKDITAIWLNDNGDLYIATNTDTIYMIAEATKLLTEQTGKITGLAYTPGFDRDSNFLVIQGAKTVKKFSIGNGIVPYSFARDPNDSRITLIGTNAGLFGYDKRTGQSVNYLKNETEKITVTDIEPGGVVIWFSTLEKGIGRLNTLSNAVSFFEYPKNQVSVNTRYPILNFSRKSQNEFYAAIADSLPAVFNTETGNYVFIDDTVFLNTVNKTTDIQQDAFGNLYITKGGGLYWSNTFLKDNERLFAIDSSLFGPYITDITIDGENYSTQKNYYTGYELMKEINLNYDEDNISVFYSCRGVSSDSLIFAHKLDNYDDNWKTVPYSFFDEKINRADFSNLNPGTYILRIRTRNGTEGWLKKEARLTIIISPPFWQTWWFWLSVITGLTLIVWTIVRWRVRAVRKQERIKAGHEKEMLELEAKALRAQMNPHFIFNCMNSIKALIQKKEEDKAISYLTTFSKLIRTIFQNSDKRESTLFDEIETCRLYTQLESMRFDSRFDYRFDIDGTIDLKSLRVPALIIQPFIENAIWHGIMPKEDGGYVHVTVSKNSENICCTVDDNGIGRKISRQNKFKGNSSVHQSKGVHLTQNRLDLDNTLNERNASIKIVDKEEGGRATGTTVILTFKEY